MKNKFTSLLIIATLLAVSDPISAKYTSPGQGTPERKVILDAIRPAVEKDLRAKVIFKVSEIRVSDKWAFLSAEPLDKSQKEIKCESVYDEDHCMMSDGLTITALLQKKSNTWLVYDYAIGATDAWWMSPSNCRLIPKEILGC